MLIKQIWFWLSFCLLNRITDLISIIFQSKFCSFKKHARSENYETVCIMHIYIISNKNKQTSRPLHTNKLIFNFNSNKTHFMEFRPVHKKNISIS